MVLMVYHNKKLNKMNNLKNTLLITTCIALFASCANTNKNQKAYDETSVAAAEAAAPTVADSSIPNTTEEKRVVVKKGGLQIETKDCNKYVTELTKTIEDMGGHTSNYNLSSDKYLHTTQNISADSQNNIYKLKQTAHLQMRLPVAKADTFVHKLMQMHGTITRLNLDEDDVTYDYDVANGIDAALVKSSVKQQAEYGIDNTIENRVSKKEIAFKSKYFWCEVDIAGAESIVIERDIRPQFYNTPFYLRALEAVKSGLQLFAELLVGILHIWPLVVIVTLVFVYRRRLQIPFGKKAIATK